MQPGTREHSSERKKLPIKRGLVILLACFVVILLYPTKIVVVPAWKIRVMDDSGRPLPDELVRQHWRHYSLGDGGDSEDRRTDAGGYVQFPERTARASLLRRVLVPLKDTAALGPHASYGPSANVMVWGGSTVPGIAWYKSGEALPDELVLRRGGNF